MAKLTKAQLEGALTRRLKLKNPEFRLERIESKLAGSVIDDGFVGMGDFERQRLIWNAIEHEFNAEIAQQIGTLLAFTVEEWHTPLEGNVKRRMPKKAG